MLLNASNISLAIIIENWTNKKLFSLMRKFGSTTIWLMNLKDNNMRICLRKISIKIRFKLEILEVAQTQNLAQIKIYLDPIKSNIKKNSWKI